MPSNPAQGPGGASPRRFSGLGLKLGAATLALLSMQQAAAVLGQEETTGGCSPDFREVHDDYTLGRFHRVLRALEPCWRAGLDPEERTEVLSYLARTYLAVDDFERAAAAVAELVSLNPNYAPSRTDSPRYLELVANARQGVVREVVSSVSKTPEALREAPATVIVVDAETIARRGYLDLEALLHDLPGFDISRTAGITYSSFYQRGYRSDSNDRTLFLVDGVENNDSWSNIAYLSRQYPLSSIERVEVVYGPASTMYGPNAYLGVINVVTRAPDGYFEGDRSLSLTAKIGTGAWNTRFLDSTVAGRSKNRNVAFSLTTRLYESDEMDRSQFEDWDYDDPDFFAGTGSTTPSQPGFSDADYGATLMRGLAGLDAGDLDALQDAGLIDGSGVVTADAIARARERDQLGLDAPVSGTRQAFANRTEDWSIFGKVRIANLHVGFQSWRQKEGTVGWYTDTVRASDGKDFWVPRFDAFYLKYEWSTPGSRLGYRLFSQFIKQGLDTGNHIGSLRSYAGGRLDLLDLLADYPAYWEALVRDETASQFRNEFTVVYDPSQRFTLVSGVEVRMSSLQGDYVKDFTPASPVPDELRDRITRSVNVSNSFDQLDMGVFAQASFKPAAHWKYVIGGRLDNNEVDALGGIVVVGDEELPVKGYGTVFTPRLAAIHIRDRFVFKAIYAEAFKDPSNFNRYSLTPPSRTTPNPDLAPEDVRNFELSAAWEVRKGLSFDLAAYRAEYSDAVALIENAEGGGQNRNSGALEISGLQANLQWKFDRYDVFANYSYTDPKTATPGEASVRIGDIAKHRLNFGLNAALREDLNADLRVNYVGPRETGPNTSVEDNPFAEIEAYTVANGAISYDGLFPGLRLQLVVNNLLDEQYYHPGVRSAKPGSFAARIPQNERSVFRSSARYSF